MSAPLAADDFALLDAAEALFADLLTVLRLGPLDEEQRQLLDRRIWLALTALRERKKARLA